jgi:hypothetical protein
MKGGEGMEAMAIAVVVYLGKKKKEEGDGDWRLRNREGKERTNAGWLAIPYEECRDEGSI